MIPGWEMGSRQEGKDSQMDPSVVLTVMRDEMEDPQVRIEAAEALDQWLANGGFMPHNTGYRVGGNTTAKMMLREEIRRTTATLKALAAKR